MGKKLLVTTVILFYSIHETLSTCPSRCKCNTNYISCVEQGLEDVPVFETINVDPVVIDLSGNKLISIDIYDFSFERNTELRELYLNNSEIIDIEDKSFDELTNLQELYLNNNNLKSIPKNMIKNNKNLIVMDLSNNIFEKFPQINSTSLEVLALVSSGISSMTESSLSGISNLRVLLLQENKLRDLSPLVFDGLHDFFFVKLAFNLWECNCETVKLFDFLTAKGYTEIATNEPIQCVTKEQNFLGIYRSNGTDEYFRQKCLGSEKVSEGTNQVLDDFTHVTKIIQATVQVKNERKQNEREMNEERTSNVYNTTDKILVEDANNSYLIKKDFKLTSQEPNNATNKGNPSFIKKETKLTIIEGRITNTTNNVNLNGTFSFKRNICHSNDRSVKMILFITVPITFLIGMLSGCYLTFLFGFSRAHLNATESSKKLLSSSTEGVTKEEYE